MNNILPIDAELRAAVEQAIEKDPTQSTRVLGTATGVSHSTVSRIRNQVSHVKHLIVSAITGKDGKRYPIATQQPIRTERPSRPVLRTRAAVAERLVRMRTLADEGYTSESIAATLGIHVQTCREHLRRAGIKVQGDVVKGMRKHNSNRIIENMVMQAENLCTDTNLIDFSKVDDTRIPEWLESLEESRSALSAFTKRLKERTHL